MLKRFWCFVLSVCMICCTGCGIRLVFNAGETITAGAKQQRVQSMGYDVFADDFCFGVPEGYVLLDDEFLTDSSRMYAKVRRGKVVATIFMNYPCVEEYSAQEILEQYESVLRKKYSLIANSTIEHNGFVWNGYYGMLKEDPDKDGYALVSVSAGSAVYLEFMSTDAYDCALDVSEFLQSFKRKSDRCE